MKNLRRLSVAFFLAGCVTAATETKPSGATGPATVEDARPYFEGVNADLRRLWTQRDHEAWVNENFITDDTEMLAAAGEEATAAYLSQKIPEATRFDGLALPDDLTRMRYLLKIAQTIPAPSDPALANELAGIESWMTSTYGKGKYCPPRLQGKCLTLDDLEKTLAQSRSYDELVDAWTGWHQISIPMKPKYARYVELANQGAKQIGFNDVGALWKSNYDLTPEQFEAEEERLWKQVKPLYDALHCYVRHRLQAKYGKDKVADHGLIPVPLLGNMWGQEWNNIYDLVEPYPGEVSLDVSKKLVEKKVTPRQMVEMGESFFVSLGFPKLPATFWDRSLFERPKDREVVCHASAWDPSYNGDLRIKVCLNPTEEDLITVHHELGHDFYFQSYETLPILFQQGANSGFHEAVGDTIALSVTPTYLKQRGLIDAIPDNPKAKINQQMKMALQKVAFLPFGLLIDKWRWDVFAGKVDPAHYNSAWWNLRAEYQGVAPPGERTEDQFDPGAKYHVAASSPYAMYFLARIYQFQFHRALCKIAGDTGPLSECSIYGNAAAGAKLRGMLALGASKPWPDAMAALSGEREADATAMLDYFKPLSNWLAQQNQGQQCGW